MRSDCGYCSSACAFQPGFEPDLADGVCKAECSNWQCAYDAGDCVLSTQGFCAVGCFQAMLGDATCQPECFTATCHNDAGDCDAFLCSAGCYPYMVGDGLCDEACYVEACLWDGSDCDCSPGCTPALLANEQCDSPCSNLNCHFDSGRCARECAPGCGDDMRGNGVCDSQCFNAACESDNGDCECAPGCLYSDIGHCKPECQVPECNYDMTDSATLFCSDSTILDCSAVSCGDGNCDFTCSQCSVTVHYKMSCCSGCCSEHYFPHPASARVCVRSPDRTTEQRPRVIYVASAGPPEGAFPSLSAAFESIFERYVEVRLLPGTHPLATGKYFVRTIRQTWNSDQQQVAALKRMKITSQSCVPFSSNCTRAVISSVYSNRPFIIFSGSRRLEVSNVDFSSSLPQRQCVSGGLSPCTDVDDLFKIRNGVTAEFVNVTFYNYKNSISSVLSVVNSTLTLKDVNFLKVMLHGNVFGLSVISAINSNVMFVGGSISLTNNIWDYGTFRRSGGAFAAVESRVVIEGVSFTNNFLALADESSKSASLVTLRDCWKVNISNCDFAFNVGRRGAVLSIYSYRWNTTSRDYQTAMKILDSSIEVSNCTFRNNTGTVGSSIYIHFLSGQQNVLITNCTFLNEFAEMNSVISGFSRNFTSTLKSKHIDTVTRSGAVKAVVFPVPHLVIRHSQFRNCNVGLFGLIALENMWNVRIEEIAIEDVPAGDARNSSTNSLDALRVIAGARVPASRPSSLPQQCQSLLNFTSGSLLEIASLTIVHANCSNVMTITRSTTLIRNSTFRWNRGTALYGFVLYFNGTSISLFDVNIEENENDNCKGTAYLAGGEANITYSRFTRNSASQGAALYLDNLQSAYVSASTFEHNSASMGGAVFAEGRGSMTISAVSSIFRNNSATSYGGAVCVVPASGQLNVKLSLEVSVFERCRSKIGSAVYTSEGAVFPPGTVFKTCQFTDNISELYGICVFELVRGEIAFTSSRFERNIGTYSSAVYASYSSAQSAHILKLSDLLFESNEATNVVSINSVESPLNAEASAITCRKNSGTCFYFESVNFTCSHCDFALNSGVSGAALQLHLSTAACEACDFQSNSAEFTGGAVLAKSFSVFACHSCSFRNNTSMWQGGGLFMEQSTLVLDTTNFTSNRARSGGSAFFLVLGDQQSTIRLSRFALNEGSSYGCINLISAFLKFKQCDFIENFSTDLMSGLVLSQSVVDIEFCGFANQTGASGVFIFAISSNMTISNSLISNGTAANTGSGLALVLSQATLSHCRFETLSSVLGGAVAAQDNSALSIENCFFQNITSKATNRGVLLIVRSSLYLSNTTFSSYVQGGVYGLQANVTVVRSSFVDASGTLGGGITCTKCALVTITGCVFERLAADRGAGVYLEGSREPDNFRITDSRFLLCQGSLSGAVYLEEFPGKITDCHFESNYGGRGGAVHIAKPSSFSSAIDISANRFINNSAVYRGGAICWEATQPLLKSNEFKANAATYGSEIASYAVKISMKRDSYPALVNATSGKPLVPPLVLDLLDIYGQVVEDDNESIAQLTSDDNDTVVSGEVRVKAKRGQFTFSDCSVTAEPGTNTSISITTSAILSEKKDFSVSMRYCTKGENLVQKLCVPCAPGTYSLTNHSHCANCLSNAICLGNSTLVPKAGYWRFSADTDALFQCPNAEACLGSLNGTHLTGMCAEGYEGAKCQACAHGYYQWGSIYCSKCSSTPTRVGVHIFVSVLLISALGALTGLVLKYGFRLLLYIKIFVNHTQVMMLFRSLGLAWPQKILQLFNAYEVFGAFPEYVISANCVMQSYYWKLVAVGLVPPILVLFALVICGVLALVKGSRRYLQEELVSTAVIVLLVAHTSVMRTMLDPFRCEELHKGEYWLLEHNIQCWTPQHEKYSFGLALPSIVIYGLALPAWVFVSLRRERRIYQSESVRFRYVILGYPHTRWYWEFVVLYWKVLVISCFALLFDLSKLFPALSAFGLMIVPIGVLRARVHDALEVQSLYVCVATLYSGLMLNAGVLGSVASDALFGVVLALNIYFLSAVAWRSGVLLYQQLKKRYVPSNQPTIEAKPDIR